MVSPMPLTRKNARPIVWRLSAALGIALSLTTLTAIVPCCFILSPQFQRFPSEQSRLMGKWEDGTKWAASIYQRPFVLHVDSQFWREEANPSPGSHPQGAEKPPSWTFAAEHHVMPDEFKLPHDSVFVDDVGFGWPKPLLAYRVLWEADAASASYKPRVIDGVRIRFVWGHGETPIWPTRILWRGLLTDVLTMLPIAAVLVAIPVFLRRLRRSLRKEYRRCGNCGYAAIADKPEWICPECGSTQQLVAPVGWTSRFTPASFLLLPRAITRLLFVAGFALIALGLGWLVVRFAWPI